MADPFDIIFTIVRSGHDMTARQIAVLKICETATPEARQVKSIAANLGLSKPVISRAASVLEEHTLITRRELPGDRRTCFLTLTRQGIALLAALVSGKGAPKSRRPTARASANGNGVARQKRQSAAAA